MANAIKSIIIMYSTILTCQYLSCTCSLGRYCQLYTMTGGMHSNSS